MDLLNLGSAEMSICETYRYLLERATVGDPRRTMTFIMLNPSTADADSDDPTIRRCRAFAASSNCGRLVVVNLFAFRATKPSELKRAADPIGPHNDLYLTNAARRASIIVCAWGIHGGFLGRDKAVRTLVSAIGRYFHLGLTRDGHPRHPLYVPSATAPILWMNAK